MVAWRSDIKDANTRTGVKKKGQRSVKEGGNDNILRDLRVSCISIPRHRLKDMMFQAPCGDTLSAMW